MRSVIRAATVMMLVLAPVLSGAAAVTQDEIRDLRAQIAALSARLAELEERAGGEETVAEAPAPAPALPPPPASVPGEHWTDRVAFSGDFRFRWETIDLEGRDSRERHRIRARPTITAEVNDTVKAGFGLATGGDSPVSSNQTLGDAGSSKGVVIDQAWFDWTGLPNTRLIGGKFENPLHRMGGNGLVWDADWRPEGFAASWRSGGVFATALATWLEGDSRNSDELAIGIQGGIETGLGGDAGLLVTASHYRMNLAGRETLYDPDDAFGNSVNPDGTYRYDFRLLELAAEIDARLGDWPVALFADYVKNLDAGDYDTGWALGASLGKASAPGTWRVRYAWQDLEADAVLGLLTDSNFGGGGTDGRGHFLSADYAVASNWIFRLSYYNNETGGDAVDRGDVGAEELDYDRLILDFRFKY